MIYWSIIFSALLWIYENGKNEVYGTIDVNLSEFQYLAGHLDPFECRRLVAALHYDDYELPKSLNMAVRKLSKDIPCLRLLLHWNANNNEGRGKTHEELERRLRQLGHGDLAEWLGKTTFKEIGKDLLNSMDIPKSTEQPTTIDQMFIVTTEAIDDAEDGEGLWAAIEMIENILFVLLLLTVVTVIGAIVIHKCCKRDRKNKKVSINATTEEKQNLLD